MNMLRTIVIILLPVLLLVSCAGKEKYFEKEYFERISRIRFPEKLELLESFDNGENLCGAVLKIENLRDFVSQNHFDAAHTLADTKLFGESDYLEYRPDFSATKNIFVIRKSYGKNDVYYIADCNRNLLWAEISYPDWAGD